MAGNFNFVMLFILMLFYQNVFCLVFHLNFSLAFYIRLNKTKASYFPFNKGEQRGDLKFNYQRVKSLGYYHNLIACL